MSTTSFTEQETWLLLNLVKAAEHTAVVHQPDNRLRDQLRTIYEKLENHERWMLTGKEHA